MEWMFGGFFFLFGILGFGSLGLWTWALVDVMRVPDDRMFRSGDKLIWVSVIVFAHGNQGALRPPPAPAG